VSVGSWRTASRSPALSAEWVPPQRDSSRRRRTMDSDANTGRWKRLESAARPQDRRRLPSGWTQTESIGDRANQPELVFGAEALIVTRDVAQLAPADATEVMRWAPPRSSAGLRPKRAGAATEHRVQTRPNGRSADPAEQDVVNRGSRPGVRWCRSRCAPHRFRDLALRQSNLACHAMLGLPRRDAARGIGLVAARESTASRRCGWGACAQFP
jgi:hypothetical protein